MGTIRDVVKARNRNTAELEPKLVYTHGITVAIDYQNDASVANRNGFVWVRENGQDSGIFQCFNPSVRNVSNLPVIVSHNPKRPLRRIIIGVDWDKLTSANTDSSFELVNHHESHEWPVMFPGADAVQVYIRAIVPFRVYAGITGVTISVAQTKYMYNGNIVQFAGQSEWDLSDSVPTVAGHFVTVLVYLNPNTNYIEVLDGVDTTDPSPINPTVPDGMIPLAYIRLFHGMTRVSEADIVEDGRLLFSFQEPSNVSIDNINKRLGWMEFEWDSVLSRHMVEG